ncbi:hypothetical protein Vadar_020953 [Vaccinium darrowii]|uniref:Uncharacterized protein n=1 Tax=Vaccinium darrowii TaxID=229202 RepID=A0ACB7X307_9ERIC|nr:hypothetical protein Vadar_020953 [Vaccinium darrowii]
MADEAKAKGNAAFSTGDYDDAIRHFTTAIELSPDNHRLCWWTGVAIGEGDRAVRGGGSRLQMAVQMPLVNSKVFYFPQGHSNHAHEKVEFGNFSRIKGQVFADDETDEVFAKIRLVPLVNNHSDFDEDDGCIGLDKFESQEKPSSFAGDSIVSKGGKFVLQIEDTDLERSTRESEEAMLCDLSWLGLDWDEGPGVGGDYGPYRQSERNVLYRQYAEKLLKFGHVYRCFCSNEELEKMKEIAKLKELPPVYTGKWANATDEEVEEEMEKGTPCTFRFRVPKDGRLQIYDLIRGEVSWSLDTLGDFVIMRSNGQPMYNFCVTVDDATMAISHVIRAEEHLPNTPRQALIYKALGFQMPYFAHASLIVAPDRSKLSKRHGAT